MRQYTFVELLLLIQMRFGAHSKRAVHSYHPSIIFFKKFHLRCLTWFRMHLCHRRLPIALQLTKATSLKCTGNHLRKLNMENDKFIFLIMTNGCKFICGLGKRISTPISTKMYERLTKRLLLAVRCHKISG